MRHEDALLVRRLAQNNAPQMAMEVVALEDDTALSYEYRGEHVQQSALPTVLRHLARYTPYLRPLLHCRRCGQKKPRDAFHNLRRGDPRHKQRLCKDCVREERRQAYRENPAAFRRREKLYRLQRGYDYRTPERAQQSRERQRAERLAHSVARAELIVRLCAEEYGCPPSALHGPQPLGRPWPRSEAAILATRAIRAWTYLHPAAIAELLGCGPEDVPMRIKLARRWTHSHQGDVRVREHLARIRERFREQRAHLKVPKKELADFTAAQRLPGRASRKTEEEHDEEPCA